MTMTTIFDVQTRQTQKNKNRSNLLVFLAAPPGTRRRRNGFYLTYSKRVA